jgi:hypothetical protein
MGKSRKASRASKPANNRMEDFMSPEQLKEYQRQLRIERDMERMWRSHGGHTRFIGTRGCK